MAEATKLKVRNDFLAGIDVGGTKIHVLDTISSNLHRFATTDFADMYALLEAYFAQAGCLPKKVVVAMAGPRNDETGAVKMTNAPWPVFEPRKAEKLFPGTEFDTSHDVAAAASGMVHAPSTDLITLKPGKAYPTGTVLAITISTGVGTSYGIWDHKSKRRIFVAGEGGHIGAAGPEEHLDHVGHAREVGVADEWGVVIADHDELGPRVGDLVRDLRRRVARVEVRAHEACLQQAEGTCARGLPSAGSSGST